MREDREALLLRAAELEPWFYSFDLGDGREIVSKLPENVEGIHETRLTMLMSAVHEQFGSRLAAAKCVDVGCHEGYFSFQIADKVDSVVGLDVREQSVEKADLIRKIKQVKNVAFKTGSCYDLSEFADQEFDLTLFLGVLYHLDNPLDALRNIARITREQCVIETQVVDDIAGSTEWGSERWRRDYKGVFALIDERPEFEAGNAEAGSYGLILCPSLQALEYMLRAVGFRHVSVVMPPPGGYEQHVRGKRVVVSAVK